LSAGPLPRPAFQVVQSVPLLTFSRATPDAPLM
jgi:hypothetical protein